GRALVQIGAGRTHPDDVLDLGAGIELLATVGAQVEAGTPLAHIDHNMTEGVPEVTQAFVIGAEAGSVPSSRLLETVRLDEGG
ncbi:MAG: thymidine phosphorylase, partial [Poseidonia sp.]